MPHYILNHFSPWEHLVPLKNGTHISMNMVYTFTGCISLFSLLEQEGPPCPQVSYYQDILVSTCASPTVYFCLCQSVRHLSSSFSCMCSVFWLSDMKADTSRSVLTVLAVIYLPKDDNICSCDLLYCSFYLLVLSWECISTKSQASTRSTCHFSKQST